MFVVFAGQEPTIPNCKIPSIRTSSAQCGRPLAVLLIASVTKTQRFVLYISESCLDPRKVEIQNISDFKTGPLCYLRPLSLTVTPGAPWHQPCAAEAFGKMNINKGQSQIG